VPEERLILVSGATGKVGRAFIGRVLSSPDEQLAATTIRALCHNRLLEPGPRLEVVAGSIDDRPTVEAAVAGATHVLHLATTKETPETIFDVAIKGLFWLLEACRDSPTLRRLVLVGGDAAVGHFFYPHPIPVTETQRHTAYPGVYALSKVLEEVMLEQYGIQYDFDFCCLRAPWIMEKDDFRYQLSFGEDVFGAPRWRDLVGAVEADRYLADGTVPVMLDEAGRPVKRNFVHVDDLVDAIVAALDEPGARRQTFNVCMDEPVDYGVLGDYLTESRGLRTVGVRTPYHSTWLDNTKAKLVLGWRPRYDLQRLADEAWSYQRPADEPRIVWYPG
jgi:nucleoside-diphosphate-sugar epimerase